MLYSLMFVSAFVLRLPHVKDRPSVASLVRCKPRLGHLSYSACTGGGWCGGVIIITATTKSSQPASVGVARQQQPATLGRALQSIVANCGRSSG